MSSPSIFGSLFHLFSPVFSFLVANSAAAVNSVFVSAYQIAGFPPFGPRKNSLEIKTGVWIFGNFTNENRPRVSTTHPVNPLVGFPSDTSTTKFPRFIFSSFFAGFLTTMRNRPRHILHRRLCTLFQFRGKRRAGSRHRRDRKARNDIFLARFQIGF